MEFRQHCGSWAGVGENLAKGVVDAGAVDMWYNEISYSPGGQGAIQQFDMNTGHYTQLVWQSTTAVGCGTNGDLLVCEYGPAGNMVGAFGNEVRPLVNPPPQCVKPVVSAPPGGASGGAQQQQQQGGISFMIGI